MVAKSYFYLNKFFQARTEVESLLTQELDEDWKYQLLLFKGNILQAQKDLPEALKTYQKVLQEFPERSQKDKVALTVAVCYEEMSEFEKAIEVLAALRTSYEEPEFLDLRIKRLTQRKENMPGAKGLRK